MSHTGKVMSCATPRMTANASEARTPKANWRNLLSLSEKAPHFQLEVKASDTNENEEADEPSILEYKVKILIIIK